MNIQMTIAFSMLLTVMTMVAEAGEAKKFKGHGNDFTKVMETKLSNGSTALLVEQRSMGWINEGAFAPGHVSGFCRGIGTVDASGTYKGDVYYCTYQINEKDGYTIRVFEDDAKGGRSEIIGGSGALTNATGKCHHTYTWGAPQGDSSNWDYECEIMTP
ncbi:MAG: hypothetical protein U1F68_16170 [Gammaproteobacteria bacterium]